jgi:phosphatidylglycerophosphate synthase
MREPIKRASEIEEPTNAWFFQPLSTLIVPWLARGRITPNMVSVAGMVFGVAAGFFYAHYAVRPSWCYIGLGLMLIWHVLDGADGQLARLTNSQSEFGKIIDGICDYVVFIAVYLGITWGAAHHHGPWVWALMLAAGAAHAVQAGAYETQRQMFDFWGLGKKSAEVQDPERPPGQGGIARIAYGYAKMQFRYSGLTRQYFDALYDFAARKPETLPQMRDAYRKYFAHTVHKWGIMCANYRTFGIFIACFAGEPLWFLVWELLALSVLHVMLMLLQRRWNAQFMAEHLA